MDKVAELRAELKSLAEKVKAGDVDAMNRANTIMNEELPAAEKAAEDAKKFAATIAAIGEINGEKKSDGKNVEVKDAKSLGEFVANCVKDNGTLKKGQHFDFTTMEFKSAVTQTRPAGIQDDDRFATGNMVGYRDVGRNHFQRTCPSLQSIIHGYLKRAHQRIEIHRFGAGVPCCQKSLCIHHRVPFVPLLYFYSYRNSKPSVTIPSLAIRAVPLTRIGREIRRPSSKRSTQTVTSPKCRARAWATSVTTLEPLGQSAR